ncbi:MAG: methionyl-tRNA formyltransferase [Clostridia bacterium]|nr:methionyl-tRNA formyltransferase [Clostridia bacterium]
MMRVLFMGTPEISALCLKRLLDDGHNVVGVVTREDKPRGRKMIMTPTETKALAEERGIEVVTPPSLRTPEFAEYLARVAPDIIVVVAFGKILPKSVLDFAPFGAVNLHVSLLPKFRGAAPMQRAIMAGESETGVTVMYMDEGLDTGDIVAVEKFPIKPDDDFEAVYNKSCEIGSALLSRTLTEIFEGRATRTPQNHAEATYAAKIEKADAKIDFTRPARELDFMIRGVTPIPGAFAYLGGRMLKICRAVPTDKSGAPGEVISTDGGKILVGCGEGALEILSVIPEGKGKMSAADFIRGRKIFKGDILE